MSGPWPTASGAFDVAVVGSGFAGSILARVLTGSGDRRVLLIESGRHPRFALGESSTPLAALALERLAARHDLPDLAAMAAYGRWLEEMPEVGRGLKRGFTFLSHRPGAPFDPRVDGRLLVAASPSGRVADSHWLRSEVDARLVLRAVADGVDYRDGLSLDRVQEESDGLVLSGRRSFAGGTEPFVVRAGFVVDATGAGGLLARHLPIAEAGVHRTGRVASSLLAGHFGGVAPLARVSGSLGPPGPYPDESAAVHHLIEEGWVYVLPFDGVAPDGSYERVSVGIELVPPASGGALVHAAADPEAAFRAIVGRYPTRAGQLGPASATEPVRFVPRAQHRLTRAADVSDGAGRWLLLPHAYAFTSPLFSTGIAWSLLAVERVADMFEAAGGSGRPSRADLAEYDRLLAREAEWIERLVAGAHRSLGDFPVLAAWSLLYFTAASFTEVSQRLIERPPEEGPWSGEPFLGAGDPVLGAALAEAERRLADALDGGPGSAARFRDRLLAALAPRDLCGFADPSHGGLHPVDLDTLVAGAPLLGLRPDQVRALLPRLRGKG